MPAHKNNFVQTSDFLIYTHLLAGIVLEWIFPTDLHFSRIIAIVLGVGLLFCGWKLIFTAKYQFKKFDQRSGPGHETMKLMTCGVFEFSRNPIYLGVLFINPALGLIFNSLWLVLGVTTQFIFLNYLLIIPEERYLMRKFGSRYLDYRKKVRRWI